MGVSVFGVVSKVYALLRMRSMYGSISLPSKAAGISLSVFLPASLSSLLQAAKQTASMSTARTMAMYFFMFFIVIVS